MITPNNPSMNNTKERLTTVVIEEPNNFLFEYFSDTFYQFLI